MKGSVYLFLRIAMMFYLIAKFARAGTCALSQNSPEEPKIPLAYCKMHSTSSCCSSAQDANIKEVAQGYFSDNCKGRFPSLKQYLCLGCDPKQPDYVYNNGGINTIRVCKSFVQDKLWGVDINTATPKYDPCGMKVPDPADPKSTIIIVPSKEYTNAQDFLNKVKPPLMDDTTYAIEITDSNCLYASTLIVTGLTLLLAFLF